MKVPIKDLLGPDGHKPCAGYELMPRQGSRKAAKRLRRDWIDSKSAKAFIAPVQAPAIKPIDFHGGHIDFVLRRQPDGGWNLLTMFPTPRG